MNLPRSNHTKELSFIPFNKTNTIVSEQSTNLSQKIIISDKAHFVVAGFVKFVF